MAITREQKERMVSEYQDLLGRNRGLILSSYAGLSVKKLEALRSRIREIGGEFLIVKNTLAELAFKESGIELPEGVLDGTTAIGFANDDIPDLAKAIVELAKENEWVSIKCGYLDGAVLGSAQVERLASLPPLPVLQAQLIGLLQAPAQRVAGVLAGSVRQIVNVIQAYSKAEPETEEAVAA